MKFRFPEFFIVNVIPSGFAATDVFQMCCKWVPVYFRVLVKQNFLDGFVKNYSGNSVENKMVEAEVQIVERVVD